MIDYIKFVLPSSKYKEQFLNTKKYNLIGKVDFNTKQDLELYTGRYKTLDIKVNYRHVTISGSIHKFYNKITSEVAHNHDDFTYAKLKDAINILVNELDFKLEDTKIQNLEFGVNIKLDRCPTRFLKENLILMDYKEPKVKEYKNKGQYREFEFSHYYMKVYNKGAQFGLDENILRLEVKTRKSQVFRSNISSVADLLDKSNLTYLKSILLKRVQQLLICDCIVPEEISNEKDLTKLRTYWNPKYWVKLHLENHRKAYRGILQFKKLMRKYDYETLHQGILRSVSNKFSDLLGYKEPKLQMVEFDSYI